MNIKYDTIWFNTKLPDEIIDIMIESLGKEDILSNLDDSCIAPSEQNPGLKNTDVRKSKTTFFDTSNWIAGFIDYYVMRSNRENFNYNLTHIDHNSLQYTEYQSGEFYNWHIDALPFLENTDSQRKLSFSLQLSDSTDYSGGDLQFHDVYENKSYFASREKGTLIIFDSRVRHRVRKVKSGKRKSIVGWYCGPSFV